VRAAARAVDAIIYLVGVPYDQFQLHPIVMRQTLFGAIAEGVQRMLLIGTVYPYGMPQTTPVTESHPREPNTFKGQKRKEQEEFFFLSRYARSSWTAYPAGNSQACPWHSAQEFKCPFTQPVSTPV